MSPPERDDRLLRALRDWDPARRTPEARAQIALNQVRERMRRVAGPAARRPRTGWRWTAVAAATGILILALVAVTWRSRQTGRRPDGESGAAQNAGDVPQRLLLVASNGVRVYWTLPPGPPATPGVSGMDPQRRNP